MNSAKLLVAAFVIGFSAHQACAQPSPVYSTPPTGKGGNITIKGSINGLGALKIKSVTFQYWLTAGGDVQEYPVPYLANGEWPAVDGKWAAMAFNTGKTDTVFDVSVLVILNDGTKDTPYRTKSYSLNSGK